MKPTYKKLKGNHYSSNELETNFVDGEALYDEIGYDQGKLIQQNAGYINTCAARMSLALLKSGVDFRGRLKIKKALLKGNILNLELSCWRTS